MNITRILSATLLSIYFILVLIYKDKPGLISIYNLQILALFINIIALTYITKKVLKLILAFSLLFVISLINYLYFQRLSIGIVYSVLNVGLAFSLYKMLLWKPVFTVNFFLILFFSQSLKLFYALEINNILPNDVLHGSRNHITILAGTMWCILITLFNEAKNRLYIVNNNISNILLLTTAFILMYITLLYTGRTGFIVSIVILLTLYIYFESSISSNLIKILIVFFLCLILIMYLDVIIALFDRSNSFNKVLEHGANDVRWMIVYNIIKLTDPINFFIGFETDLTVQQTGFSAHNSFLEAYISAGIFGFSILTLFYIKVFKMVSTLRSRLYLVLAIMCLFQSFFDTGTFFSPLTGFSITLIYIVTSQQLSILKKTTTT